MIAKLYHLDCKGGGTDFLFTVSAHSSMTQLGSFSCLNKSAGAALATHKAKTSGFPHMGVGRFRVYDSVHFWSLNGAICKERNIMSYHTAQRGI